MDSKCKEKAMRFVETMEENGLGEEGLDIALLELLADEEVTDEMVRPIKQYLMSELIERGYLFGSIKEGTVH